MRSHPRAFAQVLSLQLGVVALCGGLSSPAERGTKAHGSFYLPRTACREAGTALGRGTFNPTPQYASSRPPGCFVGNDGNHPNHVFYNPNLKSTQQNFLSVCETASIINLKFNCDYRCAVGFQYKTVWAADSSQGTCVIKFGLTAGSGSGLHEGVLVRADGQRVTQTLAPCGGKNFDQCAAHAKGKCDADPACSGIYVPYDAATAAIVVPWASSAAFASTAPMLLSGHFDRSASERGEINLAMTSIAQSTTRHNDQTAVKAHDGSTHAGPNSAPFCASTGAGVTGEGARHWRATLPPEYEIKKIEIFGRSDQPWQLQTEGSLVTIDGLECFTTQSSTGVYFSTSAKEGLGPCSGLKTKPGGSLLKITHGAQIDYQSRSLPDSAGVYLTLCEVKVFGKPLFVYEDEEKALLTQDLHEARISLKVAATDNQKSEGVDRYFSYVFSQSLVRIPSSRTTPNPCDASLYVSPAHHLL